ncbi:ATP-binding cassette domain-containing protein [Candidatus Woesearchaeota archaeon]|nr:ATP-binding cassette domain-containing protein [Candidatus Woesearchaeota archaeon]
MIEVKNLCFSYENKEILKDISLTIKEGDFLAVIGHNGSGKTTLSKHLNGLLIPSKGDVAVDGMNTKKGDFSIRKNVGMVFQNPEDQLVYSAVEEDVAFGLENFGVPQSEMKVRVQRILKVLGIFHLAHSNVNELSYGQKQLVALAGVLVLEPKYLVLDEPTTNLDPKNKKNILSTVKKLHKKGLTIILITNVLEDIRLATNVAVLSQGKLLWQGEGNHVPEKILRRANLYG